MATTKREPYLVIMVSRVTVFGMDSAVTLTFSVGTEMVVSSTTFRLVFSVQIRDRSFSKKLLKNDEKFVS